jgi:hypothetical protein
MQGESCDYLTTIHSIVHWLTTPITIALVSHLIIGLFKKQPFGFSLPHKFHCKVVCAEAISRLTKFIGRE